MTTPAHTATDRDADPHTASSHGSDGLSGPAGYGRYRDDLAHALTALLTARPRRLSAGQVTDVLGCRDLVLSCLVTITDQVLGGAGPARATLEAAATAPARVLATTLQQLPRAAASRAPSDLLAGTDGPPVVRQWRASARAALLAADALVAGEPAGWRTSPDAAWAVMADTTAAAAHALAVLDRRLATDPHLRLPDDDRAALHTSWRTGLRLVATEVSRLAHTHPLAPDADRTARPPRLTPFPVTDATTLIAGYQHTQRLLAARNGVLPIRALGHLLVAQARLGHTLADHCSRNTQHRHTPDPDQLPDLWRAHAHTAETLLSHRRAVASLNPATGHPALTQLSEVLRGVQRLAAADGSQASVQLASLAQALAPTADTLERTIAAGIERSFARGAYLVANEHVTKRRGRLPWVPATPGAEPHPLLTVATATRTPPPQQRQPALPLPAAATNHQADGPTPTSRRALHHALHTTQPARIGPPAMTQS